MKKYEVQCLMIHDESANKKLEELQNQGWEIAGDILVKNKTGWCGHNFLHIPLKREKK